MNHLSDEQLNLYLDEQLEAAERTLIEGHLATCPACQAALARLHSLFLTLEALPTAPLPFDLTEAVLAQLPASPAPRPAPLLRLALVAQVALIVLLAWGLAPLSLPRLPVVLPPLPSVEGAALVAGWLAHGQAVGARLAGLGDILVFPLLPLAPAEWALLLAALFVIWLLGNRWLLHLPSARPINGF